MSTAVLYSCTDNKPVENEVATHKSFSLRATLNAIKKSNNVTGKDATENPVCFEFVYPLTLSYNDGTTVAVASFEGLIDILSNETDTLYIEGIAFPFQVVVSNGATSTIANEADFMALIETCGIETYDETVTTATCFEFQYPFSVINQNNETIVINSEAELNDLFSNSTENDIYDLVYPVSVTYNGATVVVNDMYELMDLNDSCDDTTTPCNCTQEYAPVCVQTANGIVEYPNACYAECDGYTTADFVDCGSGVVVDPTSVGACFNFVYPVQVQSQGAVITVNSDDELFQNANATGSLDLVYPLTVTFISTGTTMTFADGDSFSNALNQNCN